VAAIAADDLVLDAFERWSHTSRAWSLGVIEEVTVQGDQDSLVLALDALIENAVDHTQVDGRIELSVHRDGTSVVIGVADTGSGIPADSPELIFDRFSRTHSEQTREAGGFGLGLAIVKAIVGAHHGSVRVQSTPGQGSVFEVVLPESRIGVERKAADSRSAIPRSAASEPLLP
jgi:two-component system OmpR family sensor kinase